MVPENILKTGVVQVQQIRRRNVIDICNTAVSDCRGKLDKRFCSSELSYY